MTNNPYHVYYDISMLNQDEKNGTATGKIYYDETRNSNILMKPNDYFLSIIRFSLDTPSLPVWIPEIVLNQSDVNKTVYKFYIKNLNNGTFIERSVEYIQSDYTVPQPAAPIVKQDLTNEYYFVNTYEQFIKMLNTTLFYMTTMISSNSIFFEFDVTTSLMKLNVPAALYNNYEIYVNKNLQTLLSTFSFDYVNDATMGDVYKFNFYNSVTNNVIYNTISYLVMKQESTSICLLNPVKSIVFTSNMLPIEKELISPPSIFGKDRNLFLNGNNSEVNSIITDFEVGMSNGNTYKNQIVYEPAIYRLIDIRGQEPLNNINIQVFWCDKYGNLHNIKLNSGCGCNLKILFRRKDFNVIDMNN